MSFYESIFSILEDVRQDIIDQYEQKGIRASGGLDKNSKVIRSGRMVILRMPYYSQFVSILQGTPTGRGPGGFPPQNALIKWIKDKGLIPRNDLGQFTKKSESNYKKMAFLIGRKIAEKGTDIYQGKRQAIDIDEIINDRLDYRGNDLADRILQDLRI